ncbi:MAG TPA: DUF2269 family protein [Gemmatimonadales bacterium]|jgi:uncharacterized membrane protein|nr:DUF2269 family protein [Gemmatimonadales bacterium]
MDEIAWLRVLHVAGAVLLLGNVTVTGAWAMLLYRRRKLVPFRSVARAILVTDLIFTVGGGTLLVVSGILLVRARGYPWLETPWLRRGILMLVLSTLCWLGVLLPDQFRMERIDPADDPRLRRTFLRWAVVGWAATAFLYIALWAMVTRR